MEFAELTEELDLEFIFERESLAYKMARGVSGMQINAKHCPECGDSRWRVYLNADTGRGNCFKCDETFSKLKFINRHYGHGDDHWKATFQIAKELLTEQGYRPKRKVTAAVQNQSVALPYSDTLPLPEGNLLYLAQRGISDEMTRYFHLRYCQFGWWLYQDQEDVKQRQRFDNRIIIPVYDLQGELVTFQGRSLDPAAEKKYLFPSTLPGTGRFLFNGQNVHKTEDVAMGEGAFDVIAMKMAFDEESDLRHVVPIGSFGKHLSYGSDDGNDQLGAFVKLKALGVKRVTIMWDGESKALISALNACKLLSGVGLTPRIAMLPAGKDPNEVLPEVVRRAYWEAKTWSAKLDVQWRLRNPYAPAEKLLKKTIPVNVD